MRTMMSQGGRAGKAACRSGSGLSEGLGINARRGSEMARLREGEPARDAEVQPVARACADSVEWGDSLCGRAGRRGRGEYPERVSARPMATRTVVESHRTRQLMGGFSVESQHSRREGW